MGPLGIGGGAVVPLEALGVFCTPLRTLSAARLGLAARVSTTGRTVGHAGCGTIISRCLAEAVVVG